jgi:hypothetical protein
LAHLFSSSARLVSWFNSVSALWIKASKTGTCLLVDHRDERQERHNVKKWAGHNSAQEEKATTMVSHDTKIHWSDDYCCFCLRFFFFSFFFFFFFPTLLPEELEVVKESSENKLLVVHGQLEVAAPERRLFVIGNHHVHKLSPVPPHKRRAFEGRHQGTHGVKTPGKKKEKKKRKERERERDEPEREREDECC